MAEKSGSTGDFGNISDDTIQGVNSHSSRDTTRRSDSSVGIVGVIVVVLLIVTVLFSLLGKDTPSFAWLLDTVSSAPKIDMTWIQNVFGVNVPDWLQWLVAPVQAIAFVGTAIVQCAVFLVHFLLRLFF